MNLLIRLTPYIKSGLVAVKYIRLPTTCLNTLVSTLAPFSSFDNLQLETMGFFTKLLLSMPNLSKTS
jgi:hypothetical protein